MKTITIPTTKKPNWSCEINGVVYEYPAGATIEVPDEVAELIAHIDELTPSTETETSPSDRDQQAAIEAMQAEIATLTARAAAADEVITALGQTLDALNIRTMTTGVLEYEGDPAEMSMPYEEARAILESGMTLIVNGPTNELDTRLTFVARNITEYEGGGEPIECIFCSSMNGEGSHVLLTELGAIFEAI